MCHHCSCHRDYSSKSCSDFAEPACDPECVSGLRPNAADLHRPPILFSHRDYVPQQFILTGHPDHIDDVIAGITATEALDIDADDLRRLATVAVSDFVTDEAVEAAEGPSSGGIDPVFRPSVWPDLNITLFNLDARNNRKGQPLYLEQVFTEIRNFVSTQLGHDEEFKVLADLNYVTGFPVEGAPWPVEGAPWPVEGAPWPVEGAPVPGGAIITGNNLFWGQWGLTDSNEPASNGIQRVRKDTLELKGNFLGDGIRIGVFDSSPFENECCYNFDRWLRYKPEGKEPLRGPRIHNWLPVQVPKTVARWPTDMSDHGLFASGLCFGAAPESEIHLIRVLNDQVQGDLHGLIRAMAWFAREVRRKRAKDGQARTLQMTVFNLSLVVRAGGGMQLPDKVVQAIMDLANTLNYPLSPFPVMALELPMQAIARNGGVIVAAAGNDSSEQATPKPAALPAAYHNVIGVGSNNKAGGLSCYSNEGDVYAPGGDGGPDPVTGEPCGPRTRDCHPGMGDCDYGVISLTLRNPGKGFAYWVGTSFAAPLASGVAALRLQDSVAPGDVANSLPRSAAGIMAGAPQGNVIKV